MGHSTKRDEAPTPCGRTRYTRVTLHPLATLYYPVYTPLMSEPREPLSDEPSDPRVGLLLRALQLSGVEPLVAASLAREHYLRIRVQGQRFEVTDPEGRSYLEGGESGQDPILHLAEEIKQSIPAKFLTEDVLDRDA
jgi:hypothetical protein